MLLSLTSQPIEQKYNFLITEYKRLQAITNILHTEKSNIILIHGHKIKRLNLSNQIRLIEIKEKNQRRKNVGIITGTILLITAFSTGLSLGIRVKN